MPCSAKSWHNVCPVRFGSPGFGSKKRYFKNLAMKPQNKLQQAINLAFQQVINIVEIWGVETGSYDLDKNGKPIFYKSLEIESISKANDLAAEMHGLYIFRFFEKDGLVLVKITSSNGCYILPANTDSLICLKKECSKAWGQLKKELPRKIELKQPVKIEIQPRKETFRPKMKVISIKRKQPQKTIIEIKNPKFNMYYKNYYLYKGQKYFYSNKFIAS